MAENSKIEWTDASWNPIVGCSIVSPGCTNCYAMKLAHRLERMGSPIYRDLTQMTKAGAVWSGKVEQSNWGIRTAPFYWRRPRRVFVNSMSDLFHESVPDKWIDEVFAVMALCPQHTFQVLTKRADRMRRYVEAVTLERIAEAVTVIIWPISKHEADTRITGKPEGSAALYHCKRPAWPLPNVWLGISVEDQRRAEERIPHLVATPAAVRFLSCEPLLGEIAPDLTGIGWVIGGGESGPKRRPMDLAWARGLRDQCAETGTPYFFKQVDKVLPIPDDLMIRQFPAVAQQPLTQPPLPPMLPECRIETD